MPLREGERLGAYEIRAPLGVGGMGEVYRAVDTGLGREVAVKILPPIMAGDSERLVRFDREARLLASLNHPNIATLFGFERHEKSPFIVMELVEGETLAQRLKHGALPRDEDLEVLQQIAEGLEAAHESGVIHRDLKPANIKITPEGKVKLLDFGLAKALEGEHGVRSDVSLSPTLTAAATQRGEVMGTASYMSPEQARGKPVDRRTDIWAFGCVLYECLTGKLAYHGETISDTISLILQREPEWEALPADTPPRLVELLRRCLEKDARRRLRDIGEARLEIEKVRAGNLAPTTASGVLPMASGGIVTGAAAPARAGFGPAAVTGALAFGLVAGAAAWTLSPWGGASSRSPAGVIRFSVAPPAGIEMRTPKISPDGSVLLFYGNEEKPDPDGRRRRFLYVRSLESAEPRRIEESEGVFVSVYSPDSRWIAFGAPLGPGSPASSLRKVPVDGSAPPVVLAGWGGNWKDDLLWLEDGDLLVVTRDAPLLIRIPSDGGAPGEPVSIQIPGAAGAGTDINDEVTLQGTLPDPSSVLVTVQSWVGRYHDETHVLDVKTMSMRRILDDGTSPVWSPTGHLLFTRDDTLLAVPFDEERLEPIGGPVSLAKGLGLPDEAAAGAYFTLSRNGTLAHLPGGRRGGRRSIVVVGKDGSATPWSDDRRAFRDDLALSRDGRRLATTVMTEDLLFSIWISEVDRPRLRQAASLPGMDCFRPLWMPDSDRLLFKCGGREGKDGIYSIRADGGGRPALVVDLEAESLPFRAASVTPDGRWLLMDSAFDTFIPANLLQVADLSAGESAKLRSLLPDLPIVWNGRISPDGRWFCYVTPTSGGMELYVRRFNGEADPGPPILAAVGEIGGADWAPAGSTGVMELLYRDRNQRLYKVTVGPGGEGELSDPWMVQDLSNLRPPLAAGFLAPDGRIFAVQEGVDEQLPTVAEVTVNWFDELKRLMPAGR